MKLGHLEALLAWWYAPEQRSSSDACWVQGGETQAMYESTQEHGVWARKTIKVKIYCLKLMSISLREDDIYVTLDVIRCSILYGK